MLKIVFALPPCFSSLPLPTFASHISTLFFCLPRRARGRALLPAASAPSRRLPSLLIPPFGGGRSSGHSLAPPAPFLPRKHPNSTTAQQHNKVQRDNVLQTSAFFSLPARLPQILPPPRTAFILVASVYQSATAFSMGGGIVVAMVVGRRHRGCYVEPYTKAALHSLLPSRPPYLLPSRPKKRCPLALPSTSSHHSFCSFPSRSSWLRWSGGGAFLLCLSLRLATLGCLLPTFTHS